MSLILDALRKSEHGRHGASDSVLPLIVTPRAGRVRKKRVAYLPILIMLLVVSATVVIFLYRETIFPPRSVAQVSPVPAVAKPQMTQRSQQQTQRQRQAEVPVKVPVKALQQALPPDVEPAQSIAPLKSEKLPVSKPEITMPDSAVADRSKLVERSLPLKPESATPPESKPKPAPKLIAKPKPEPVKRDAIPAALSTFPADFIRKIQPLHLDFHVYSSDISRRMVYINNREYEEGDRLKNGLKVVRIVPRGAVMQWNQQTFLLTAQD
ncbi:MAG: general secretion pathway protein GspB [Gammaproteobacteria bacterium]|nr:general secretion pathway protein GspB [Gammaproteobacteria bacterium]